MSKKNETKKKSGKKSEDDNHDRPNFPGYPGSNALVEKKPKKTRRR